MLGKPLRACIRRGGDCAPATEHPSQTPEGDTRMAEPTLELGSEGQDVTDLQEALIELDLKPGKVDGIFGMFTESAVKGFQTWASLLMDGIVGPTTWAKLDDADKSDPTLKNGSKGVAVRGVQRRLIAAGFGPDEIDGRFEAQTEAAVRAFQKEHEVDVDGIVGPVTWKHLNENEIAA